MTCGWFHWDVTSTLCLLPGVHTGVGGGGGGGGGKTWDIPLPPPPKNFHNQITLECSVHVLITLEWL